MRQYNQESKIGENTDLSCSILVNTRGEEGYLTIEEVPVKGSGRFGILRWGKEWDREISSGKYWVFMLGRSVFSVTPLTAATSWHTHKEASAEIAEDLLAQGLR